jgi:hypothetical protein
MTAPGSDGLHVADQGTQLSFFFLDLLRYAGPGSPASLAMAYQAMRLSFPLLDGGKSLVRREIGIETAYRGPGARDGFELRETRPVRPLRNQSCQNNIFYIVYGWDGGRAAAVE